MKVALFLSTLCLFTACQTGSPLASPTATPDMKLPTSTQTIYSPPVSLRIMGECGTTKTPIIQYKLTATGEFSYPVSDGIPNLFESPNIELKTAQLTAEEQKSFQAELNKSDLDKAFKSSKPVPDDAPQTEECRAISDLEIQVGKETKTYDFNGRKFNHDTNYRTQWKAIHTAFENLAKKYRSEKPIPSEPKYAFPPLKFIANGECGMGSQTLYEIKEFDTFVSYDSSGKIETERKLSTDEREKLTKTLNQSDLALKLESSTKIPDDAPQTKECRTIQTLNLNVFGIPQSYDSNGRSYSHTEAYHTAFEQVRTLLEGFDKIK